MTTNRTITTNITGARVPVDVRALQGARVPVGVRALKGTPALVSARTPIGMRVLDTVVVAATALSQERIVR